MVKTQKWYYFCNMRCAYLPIDRSLQREEETERETKREGQIERERET